MTTLPEQLWLGTQQTRQEILQTAFVKGIKEKNLDPVKFCQYTIQDTIYVYKSKLSVYTALRRSTPGSVKDLLSRLSRDYDTYVRAMLDDWLIKENVADSAVKLGQEILSAFYVRAMLDDWLIKENVADSAVKLGEACTDYIDYEKNVADTMDPIYLCVALLPCLRTLYWIGQQLATADKGIYTAWAKGKFTGSTWMEIEAQVEAAYQGKAITKAEAQIVYNRCMEYERQFFDSVRNQNY